MWVSQKRKGVRERRNRKKEKGSKEEEGGRERREKKKKGEGQKGNRWGIERTRS